MSLRIFLLLILIFPLSEYSSGQGQCSIFTQYKNEIKIWAAATIDSLKKAGTDTIIFYGIGTPETGWVTYGTITWVNNGITKKIEIKSNYFNRASDKIFRFRTTTYDSIANFEAIQFYSDYRLDTVKTNPKELYWMSHDFLHFVYSTIHGKEVCFTAEDYLLRDREHLRARWISKLSGGIPPWQLCR